MHDHDRAIVTARQWLTLRPLILDTETTGLGPTAEVVEVAVLEADGLMVFESLVRPRHPIPAEAARVHGINDLMVADASDWTGIWLRLAPLLNQRMIAAYNAAYDVKVIRHTTVSRGLTWSLDTAQFECIMLLYAAFRGEWNTSRGSYRWHRLETAARQCGINLPNSHRAADDARLALAVLKHIAGETS
jgi:DNA polymerase-3 subunit epsilon